MKILHIDSNHPLMIAQLQEEGFENDTDYLSSKAEIEDKIAAYDGIVIRSRFRIDKGFIDKASRLKFIARVGAGMENIDTAYAHQKGIAMRWGTILWLFCLPCSISSRRRIKR